MYPLQAENPVCIQILRAYAGIGYAETQSPGMLRKPGDLPQVCPRPKKFNRLATRDTLHGSRPNLRQHEPDGRIVPTAPDVFGTKVRARRDVPEGIKKSQLYIYIQGLRMGAGDMLRVGQGSTSTTKV